MPGIQPPRRWFQFGIGTLLFLMCGTAGFFAGYRGGFQVGAAAKTRPGVYAKVYYVKDIVGLPPNDRGGADHLTRFIKKTISPQSWADRGGPGAISYYANNRSIVVSNDEDVQMQVADCLEQIRRLQKQGKAAELDAIIASTLNSP